MIYPIYVYGSPVLRKETESVAAIDQEIRQLVDDMFETMYAANGVGLAAPQIGKSLRIFVIDASIYEEDDPSLTGFKKAFINAEIYEHSDETVVLEEGCLSLPKLYENVRRPESIRIRYTDESGAAYDETYSGTAARVIQHEYDHIEGKLFADHLPPLRKTLLSSKLSGFAKGKFKASYKTKLPK